MIRRLLLPAIAVVWTLVLSAPAQAQQFELGDVIVSGEIPLPGFQEFEAKILRYDRLGRLKSVLADVSPFEQFGRLAFSPLGVLHTTSGNGIVTVSPGGKITRYLYGADIYYALSFAADGTLLAGYRGILSRFSASGTRLNSYAVPGDVISLDLAGDQCTAYWIRPGVQKFDICKGTPLPAFASLGGADFRLLPGGGVAITRTDGVEILSSDGSLLRKIGTVGGALALDVDGTSIWLAQQGGLLSKFDLATGNQLLGPIQTGLTGIDGLTVYGEPRAAFVNGPLTAIPTLSPRMLLMLCVALAAFAMLRLRM